MGWYSLEDTEAQEVAASSVGLASTVTSTRSAAAPPPPPGSNRRADRQRSSWSNLMALVAAVDSESTAVKVALHC